MEQLKELDEYLLLLVNGWNSPFMDFFMLEISYKYTWVGFYAVLIMFLIYRFRWQAWLPLLSIIALISLADFFASGFMKPTIGRLRPCYVPELQEMLHMVKGCGGKYGFISSHAANTFALATFFWLIFRKTHGVVILMFIWAFVVSLSRIYLGVHYPSDIFLGAVSGVIWAFLIFRLFSVIEKKLNSRKRKKEGQETVITEDSTSA